MTTRFFESATGLWEQITDHVRCARHNLVAVAYLSKGARELLPLKRGDTLVVDISEGAVKAGQTHPDTVQWYVERGVSVYHCTGLHAKVFVCDDVAIVGSANASSSSRDRLVEAALLSDELAVVAAARGFVQSLVGDPVTPGLILLRQQQYCAPHGRIGSRRKPGGTNTGPDLPRLWIAKVRPYEYCAEERAAEKAGLPQAEGDLQDRRLFEVDTIAWSSDPQFIDALKPGHLIIQIWEEGGKRTVYPPCRVLGLRRYTKANQWGTKGAIVFFETSCSPRTLGWQTFKTAFQQLTNTKITRIGRREIRNPTIKQRVLALWPSPHADQEQDGE